MDAAALNQKKGMSGSTLKLIAIITMCAEGENPDTADYDPSACTHDCSTCGGCH